MGEATTLLSLWLLGGVVHCAGVLHAFCVTDKSCSSTTFTNGASLQRVTAVLRSMRRELGPSAGKFDAFQMSSHANPTRAHVMAARDDIRPDPLAIFRLID